MQQYNFDQIIDRAGTDSVKCDALNEYFGRPDLIPLWVADMDFAACPAVTQALGERMAHAIYGYTMATDRFWQSIIDWNHKRHGFDFTRDEVTYVPGIVTGFGLVVSHFTRPGDKVVIQEPVYHPFKNVIKGNGRRVLNNPLLTTADGFYAMALEGLEHIFATEQPRMMVLCNPHNPIGIVWDADTLREVARLARKYGVMVFSDEIHCDLTVYGNVHHPFASVSDDAAAVAVSMGAPSKTFNIAGIKSSWCVVKNPELRRPFFTWLETNELCSPSLVASTATLAAYEHGSEWLDECLAYIQGNIDFVHDYCRDHIPGIVAVKPQASFLVWLDCSGLGLAHERVVDIFVNKALLALNDGTMFGQGGEQHMRLNVAVPRSILEKAMSQLCDAVKNL